MTGGPYYINRLLMLTLLEYEVKKRSGLKFVEVLGSKKAMAHEEIKLGDVEAPPKLIAIPKVLKFHFFDNINAC